MVRRSTPPWTDGNTTGANFRARLGAKFRDRPATDLQWTLSELTRRRFPNGEGAALHPSSSSLAFMLQTSYILRATHVIAKQAWVRQEDGMYSNPCRAPWRNTIVANAVANQPHRM